MAEEASQHRGGAELTRRYLLLLIGLSAIALGVAFSIRSDLGTTSISSLPYVISLVAPLTVGTATALMNLALVGAQVLILRRRFRPGQLLQLPVLFLFSLLTDLALWALRDVGHSAYWQQWLLSLTGIVIVGVGVACTLLSDTVMLPGDALSLTLSRELTGRLGTRKYLLFGYVKIVFDVMLVASAVLLSLLALGAVQGVREGTVAAALLIGFVAKQVTPLLRPLVGRWIG